MGKFIDKTGFKYGRLTVLERAANRGKRIYWECRCDCGNITHTSTSSLNKGSTKSCGCLQREIEKETLNAFTYKRMIKPNMNINNFYVLNIELRRTNCGNNENWLYVKCPFCDNLFWQNLIT